MFGVSREPTGRCEAKEGPEHSPLRVEPWRAASLGWFKGQHLLGLMAGHMQRLLSSTLSLSSGIVKALSSLSHWRKAGSVFHSIFVFSKNALKFLSLKVWRLNEGAALCLVQFLYLEYTTDSPS